MITGNHTLEAICRTPGRGEAPVPTDDPAEENNTPGWRSVVITYWE